MRKAAGNIKSAAFFSERSHPEKLPEYVVRCLIINVQHIPVVGGLVLHQRIGGRPLNHRTVNHKVFRAGAGIHGNNPGFIHNDPRTDPLGFINATTVGLVGRCALKSFKFVNREAVNQNAPAGLVGIKVYPSAGGV